MKVPAVVSRSATPSVGTAVRDGVEFVSSLQGLLGFQNEMDNDVFDDMSNPVEKASSTPYSPIFKTVASAHGSSYTNRQVTHRADSSCRRISHYREDYFLAWLRRKPLQ